MHRYFTRIVGMAIFLCAVALIAACPARADGIIIPIPIPPRPPEPMPIKSLAIKYHEVTVTIEEQIATTHIDQVFLNELPYDIEGDYIFPLPERASISQFAMWVDGQRLEAQVLEKEEARRIYEEIVRERRDPALLEYVGRNAFRARIFPIPARGEKRIELEYTEVLPRDGGLVRYAYPLNTEKFSTKPLEHVRVEVHLAARGGLGAIYSPSHEVQVNRESATLATVTYEVQNVRPDRDFLLYYALEGDALGLNVLSYKEPGEEGFFLLLLTPPAQVAPEHAVPKDVYFVLDVSGSMRGEKLAQAKEAARYILDHLNAEDRFNIIAFSSGLRTFAASPQPLGAREEAYAFVNELQAGGGTNIARALEEALRQARPGRPQMILFLTDGLPTEGETNSGKIVARAQELATEEVRLFAFGVGYDVNTALLDLLAQTLHGATSYVRPDEDIERALSAFFDKVSLPVLTDLRLDFGEARVEETYPDPLPDLFAGEQIILVGRYRQPGRVTIRLKGRAESEPQAYTFEGVEFRERGGSALIPRLWATRKIGHLLTQIRLHGPNRELVDEIIALSVRYGIVTPYTSFLVDETEDVLSTEGRRVVAERTFQEQALAVQPAGVGSGGPGWATGKGAVDQSIAQSALRSSETASTPDVEQVRVLGAKAFVLRQGVWTDTLYESRHMRPERVSFGGARYFDLLRQYPSLGAYFALGERVLVVWEGKAYQVVPGEEEASETAVPQPTPTRLPPEAPSPPQPTSPAVTPLPTASPLPMPIETPAPMPTPPSLWERIAEWWEAFFQRRLRP